MTNTDTFGEALIGYRFNPQGDPDVNIVKKTFASLVDLIETFPAKTRISKMLKEASLVACVQAQMLIVKLITLNE
jgi:hypothetical protein